MAPKKFKTTTRYRRSDGTWDSMETTNNPTMAGMDEDADVDANANADANADANAHAAIATADGTIQEFNIDASQDDTHKNDVANNEGAANNAADVNDNDLPNNKSTNRDISSTGKGRQGRASTASGKTKDNVSTSGKGQENASDLSATVKPITADSSKKNSSSNSKGERQGKATTASRSTNDIVSTSGKNQGEASDLSATVKSKTADLSNKNSSFNSKGDISSKGTRGKVLQRRANTAANAASSSKNSSSSTSSPSGNLQSMKNFNTTTTDLSSKTSSSSSSSPSSSSSSSDTEDERRHEPSGIVHRTKKSRSLSSSSSTTDPKHMTHNNQKLKPSSKSYQADDKSSSTYDPNAESSSESELDKVKILQPADWEKDRTRVTNAITQILLQQSREKDKRSKIILDKSTQHVTTTDTMSNSHSHASIGQARFDTFEPPDRRLESNIQPESDYYSDSDDVDKDEDYDPTSDADANENSPSNASSDSNKAYHTDSGEENIYNTPSPSALSLWNRSLSFKGIANGLHFRPNCNSFCMTRCTEIANPCNKDHSDLLSVYLNHSGDYVLFPSKTYHRGFYGKSDRTLFTVQLFTQYKSIDSHHSRRSPLKDEYYELQTLGHEFVQELFKDLMLYWDTSYNVENDDENVYAHTLPTKYKNQPIDKACNRVIDLKRLPCLSTGLSILHTKIEELYPTLDVKKVWILKKFRKDDGFPTWHQDLVSNADVTIVVNVGAYKTGINDKLQDNFSESVLWFYSHCETSSPALNTTVPIIDVAKWTMEYVKTRLNKHRHNINKHLLMSEHFKNELDGHVHEGSLIPFMRIIVDSSEELQKDSGFTENELMRYHAVALTSTNEQSMRMNMSAGEATSHKHSASNTEQGSSSTERKDSQSSNDFQQHNDNYTTNDIHPESETKVRMSSISA